MKAFVSALLFLSAIGSASARVGLDIDIAAWGAAGQSRELQSCPDPSGAPCTADENPVKCGPSACEYANQCNANAAGFAPTLCWPATCTEPDAGTACTFESQPVVCGDSRCPYANYCLAEAAGFTPLACFAEACPAPAGACTFEYDPFLCLVDGVGLCSYDNSCLVSAVGIDPAGQCVRSGQFGGNPATCPIVSSDANCEFDYDPLRCNGECLYTNSCEASSAGLDVSDPLVCQSDICAVAAGDTPCTADLNPVVCYPGECQYSNQCTASAAGYLENNCISASCPLPDSNTFCTFEYDPQSCDIGGLSCTYDNPCVASAAGATNCVSEIDPTPPETCPTAPGDSPCTLEIDEKLCGPDACFYTNQCLASGAGFDPVECRSAVCPISNANQGDCAGFDIAEVQCGPYNCPYLSICFANRAGWVSAECSPLSCPAPPAGTACTYEYDPLVCYSSALLNGANCAYSNPCQAQAAGYDPSPYSGQCVRPSLSASRSAPLPELQSTGDSTSDETTGAPTAPGEVGATEAPGSSPADDSGAISLAAKGSMLALVLAFFVM